MSRWGTGRPTTARLRGELGRAARVVVVQAAPYEANEPEAPRLELTGAGIAELAGLLAIVDGGTGDVCRCAGWPTILLYGADGVRFATWTLHHGTDIRAVGDCDAQLLGGAALDDWLAERGLTGPREARAELAAEEARQERRRRRWLAAAPPELAAAAAEVARTPGDEYQAWSERQRHARIGLAGMARWHWPDRAERIRALLAWLALGAREEGGGLTWYDLALQGQLLAEEPESVLAALTARPCTPAHLDGAAQLFAAPEWTGARGRGLPEPLRSVLLAHIEAHGTGPMRIRAGRGYYGGGGGGSA
ncbi:hypothetical protein HUT16_05540 [Kitasatospora sp. NA04385]|uniref:hypothetical protein n=1 Tax=Kitasatospora sp. NA04385 TaxID=2742135 RepID=UPI0015918824|nr:hypothetical protein [Kitasatospora sp. NA04385]QKW18595.1 hypothetical protein HUT16_05540 [Kitasatospora sp. NA04385]